MYTTAQCLLIYHQAEHSEILRPIHRRYFWDFMDLKTPAVFISYTERNIFFFNREKVCLLRGTN